MLLGAGLGRLFRARSPEALRAYLMGLVLPMGWVPWQAMIAPLGDSMFSAVSLVMEGLNKREFGDALSLSFFVVYFPLGWWRPAHVLPLWMGTVVALSAILGVIGYPTWGGVARFGAVHAVLVISVITLPALGVSYLGALTRKLLARKE